MENIRIDFKSTNGKIKNMNSVNNGPVRSVRNFDTFDAFKAARIPYARNHDASFYANYGGEFTVDVHRIFRDFDADVNDPASYSFYSTDGKNCGIILTHFNDNDYTEKKTACLKIKNAPEHSAVKIYKLDEDIDMALISEEQYSESNMEIAVDLPLFTSYYIEIKEINI